MKKYLSIFLFLILWSLFTNAQEYYQYFDGADTSIYTSILVHVDEDSTNIWQVGKPQKAIFDSAASFPNVIITDTVNAYPSNNLSQFSFRIVTDVWSWGILALRWMQKLDFDEAGDGGIVEFSIDDGLTWQNVFDNPYVYNFYGFEPENAVLLNSGEIGFSGADSSWKDIWLCFDLSWSNTFPDTAMFRFTMKSDSVDNGREGWMIDNMMASITIVHTVKNPVQTEYLRIYPNPANGRVYIEAEKLQEYHIIEHMELINASGQVVDSWKNCPTKFWFDSSKYPPGNYWMNVQTNIRSETLPFVILSEE